jgi:hypothetical protein
MSCTFRSISALSRLSALPSCLSIIGWSALAACTACFSSWGWSEDSSVLPCFSSWGWSDAIMALPWLSSTGCTDARKPGTSALTAFTTGGTTILATSLPMADELGKAPARP